MGRRDRNKEAKIAALPSDDRILEAAARLQGAGLRNLAHALGVPRGLHGALRERLRELKSEGLAPARAHVAAHVAATGPEVPG